MNEWPIILSDDAPESEKLLVSELDKLDLSDEVKAGYYDVIWTRKPNFRLLTWQVAPVIDMINAVEGNFYTRIETVDGVETEIVVTREYVWSRLKLNRKYMPENETLPGITIMGVILGTHSRLTGKPFAVPAMEGEL